MSTVKDFLELPEDEQKQFQKMFKATLNQMEFNPQKKCWIHRKSGEIMTIEQEKTLKMLINI